MRDHGMASSAKANRQGKGDWLDKVLPVLSLITMAFTAPQVWNIWVEGNTSGVSILSWGAYFIAACVWLVDGVRKHDKTIWVACIGWVVLDGAVFIGTLVHR
jgi:uncharacterized protein with PQ loop repeat